MKTRKEQEKTRGDAVSPCIYARARICLYFGFAQKNAWWRKFLHFAFCILHLGPKRHQYLDIELKLNNALIITLNTDAKKPLFAKCKMQNAKLGLENG